MDFYFCSMRKTILKFTVIAMVLALLGLIGIQFYWIGNAVELREEQFKQTINTMMYDLVQRLEKREAIEGFRRHPMGQEVYRYSGGNKLQISFDNDTSLKEAPFKLRIQEVETNDTVGGYIKNVKTIKHVIEGEAIETALSKSDIDSKVQDLLLERENAIQNRSSMVDEVISEWFASIYSKDINQRIPPNELDSVIYTELAARGIKTKYKFGVFDAENQPLYKENCKIHDLETATNDMYRVRLFPNDWLKAPYFLVIHFPLQKSYMLRSMWVMLASSAIFIIVIILVFIKSVLTILRQRKLSEVKNDFINNMTHELKTPIATITLACEALNDPDVNSSEESANSFIGMIKEENKRLGILVENALKTAILDKGELTLKKTEVDVVNLINKVVNNIEIQVKNKSGIVKSNFSEKSVLLSIDKVHFGNVIYNLIDNAIKYSKDTPDILVEVLKKKEHVIIKVSDKGVGISRENQKRIFDKLYRVPTGNIHNVKGYGLGLAYVKATIEKHGGEIAIKSSLGQGSTFIITLPI